MRRFLALVLFVLMAVACRDAGQSPPDEGAQPEVTPPADEATRSELTSSGETPDPAEEPIYLAIIWHQHQPVYFKNPATNSYIRPWVRVHATKDYVDMATTVAAYPDVHVTFNLTPSLLRQIEDLAAGARDDYWLLAEIPAADLTEDQQAFIRERFFDTNRNIVSRFPRYAELLARRDAGDPFSTADYRDLQILFNLAWVDPDWLAEEPLKTLVDKESGYTEEDKAILFAEHMRLIEEIIPVHRRLQEEGQIEITMTPFAHPILPLLVDTNSAKIALPDIELPNRFVFGLDAQRQVELGVELYTDLFGRAPRGMWPAEGSVSQQIITMVANNGIDWMATDEGVLANSLGFESFTRNSSDLVQEADTLYRPYLVEGQRGGPVAIVFRDVVISDKVGFTYSGMDGAAAAQDFVDRIHAIRKELNGSGTEGPHLVSVILDGENAWEFYDQDGKEFLNTLYQLLTEDALIQTVTPSEFLAIAPHQPQIEELWAGSWINHDFSTWIGEQEENDAWNLLLETRQFVQSYENGTQTPPSEDALAEALELMYIAEGSDWFWWYGADQTSGNDESFDLQFRETMKEIYRVLGETPPVALDIPIIPLAAASSTQAAAGLISPNIDGVVRDEEWAAAGVYAREGGVMQAATTIVESLAYGFDSQFLYLNAVLGEDAPLAGDPARVDIYLAVPGGGPANSFSGATWIGFQANRLLSVDLAGGESNMFAATGLENWNALEDVEGLAVAFSERALEAAVPLSALGNADIGDRISLRLFLNDVTNPEAAVPQAQVPGSGPAVLAVPDLGNLTVVLEVDDPAGDDHGPGSYTYPQDSVFSGGNFDIIKFVAGFDEENIIFKFDLRGPVENHWSSPNGMSGLTLDVYIDQDGDGAGGIALLPGRNLALADGFAWDVAIHAEGWTPAIYHPGEQIIRVAEASEFQVIADSGQRKVTIRVPKNLLGDTPDGWRFAAMVMGQEGFPSGGVLRIRDVSPASEQWRFGGAPAGAANHTRVIDLVWPEPGAQETFLSDFTPNSTPQTDQTAADYARIPLLDAGN